MPVLAIAFTLCFVANSAADQVLRIHQVQGPGSRSPYEGQVVKVRGVVTGVTANGFFIQELQPDQDAATSEGLFIFMGYQPAVTAGQVVEVEGKVQEYVSASLPHHPPLTELVNPSPPRMLGQGELPAPVPLPADLREAGVGGWEQLEALEGMRVEVESLMVTGPTLGRLEERTASATSTGVFFGVLAPQSRPFREPGFPTFDPFPTPCSPCPQRFDGNPEVLRVDSQCLLSGEVADVAAFSVVEGLRGPLTFASGRFTLCPEPGFSVKPAVPKLPPLPQTPWATAVLASWNLQRFYDDEDDPQVNEPVLEREAWARRKAKFAEAVTAFIGLPHVLLLQEVENFKVLQELAQVLEQEAQARFGMALAFTPYLFPHPSLPGLQIGLLLAATPHAGVAVEIKKVEPILQQEQMTNPDGSRSPLFDRPPLFCELVLKAPRRALPLALVGVHLRSLLGLLSEEPGGQGWPTEGARVRAKRAAQAQRLASWVEAWQQNHPEVPLVVLGDFNGFAFSDGVVDVVGTVAGVPAPDVLVPTEDVVTQDLVILTRDEPPEQQYSFIYDGSAQALDHALVSSSLFQRGVRVKVKRPRVAADWPESLRNTSLPWRLSDHDPLVLHLYLAPRPVRSLQRRDAP
ncbi:MAG: endonuclease/exonuclease/phosphatase family protein [Thermoanaerobaculaceae bacterium]